MIFHVVINLKAIFDVVIVSKFFDVLFGFRRCDFRSSELFPVGTKEKENKKKVCNNAENVFQIKI